MISHFETLDPGTSGTLNALHETQVLASNNIINNIITQIQILMSSFQILKRPLPFQCLICKYVLTITINFNEMVVVVVVLVVVNYV